MYRDNRFWEVDLLRGIAVVLMMAYHFIYDLAYFTGYKVLGGELFWFYFPRLIAGIFIFLIGVSLVLKHYGRPEKHFGNYVLRGAWIFALGMVLTIITWLLVRDVYIIFGVLHFAGIATIIAYFFLNSGKKNILYGAVIIAAGLYLGAMEFPFYYLMWLGFIPEGLRTLDYFPLLPWFGLILIGIFFGEYFYKGYKRRISIPDYSNWLLVAQFCFLGRHSLLFYFLHQPAIFVGIGLTNFFM